MQFEKKELKGRMWKETNSKVLFKGPIYIEGKDQYFTMISTQVNGQEKIELLQSVGLIYRKDDQSRENAPDLGGPITAMTAEGSKSFKYGAWEQANPDTGDISLSCGLLIPQDQNGSAESASKDEIVPPNTSVLSDDDIPF